MPKPPGPPNKPGARNKPGPQKKPGPVAADRPMEVIRKDDDLCVWRINGTSDRLLISMSSIGDTDDDQPVPQFMSIANGTSDTVLFISDPRRSWLSRPGIIDEIKAVIETEAARVNAQQIGIFGGSMGGFSALAMPAFTNIQVAIAFSPQFSVDPAVVPEETRWMDLRQQIPAFAISNIADVMNDTTRYYLFFGRHQSEVHQRRLVRTMPNLQFYVMPNTSHNTALRMKKAQVLLPVLKACLKGHHKELNKIMTNSFQAPRRVHKPAQVTEVPVTQDEHPQ